MKKARRLDSSSRCPKWKLSELTITQKRVLFAISKGEDNKQIAYDLGLNHKTVEYHWDRLKRKLGIPNKITAARYYWKHYENQR